MKTEKVAIYIRVSTEEQAKEGYSLEAQEETLKKYCDTYNYSIAGKYIDDGKVEEYRSPCITRTTKGLH